MVDIALRAIWMMSLAFASLSILCVFVLLLRRKWISRHEAIEAQRRVELSDRVLAWLASDATDPPQFDDSEHERLVDLVFELFQILRGDDEARLLDLLRRLNIADSELVQLNRGNAKRRTIAARRLARLNDPRIINALRKTVAMDPDSDSRRAAAQGLVQHGGADDLVTIIRDLHFGTNENAQLVSSMMQRRGPDSVPRLLAVLRADLPDFAKVTALQTLGRIGAYDALSEIIGFLQSRSVGLRAQAVNSLADLGHPEAHGAVEQALHDPAWMVRTAAAKAAGRIGILSAAPRLIELLDEREWWTRYQAADALYHLGGEARAALVSESLKPSRRGRVAQMLLLEKAS